MKKFLLALTMVLLASNAHAANWYVDNAVSTSGNGSSWASAWNNFASVVWGSSGVKAGDTLYISGGSTSQTYYETLNVKASGSSGSPITIRPGSDAGHNGQVIIDCQDTRNCGISMGGSSYIVVDGIGGDAVHGNTAYGMRISNWNVGSGSGGGVYSSSGPTNITVRHIEFTGTNTTSMSDDQGCVRFSGGTNFDIGYLWGHGPESARPSTQDAYKWHISGIVLWANRTGTSYTSTLIHDCKMEILFHDGIKSNYNASIYNNEVCDIGGSGHSDSLLGQDPSYVAIYGNYVHGRNEQVIYVDAIHGSGGHVRIYNNIVNGGSQGVVLDPEGLDGSGTGIVIDDILIANNTFYATGNENKRPVGRGSVTNLKIVNNIFGLCTMKQQFYQVCVNPSKETFVDSNSFDYDVYFTNSVMSPYVADWSGGKTLAQLQALSPPREAHGKYTNPVFVNPGSGNFHISPTDTVVKGAGTNLSSYFTTDKDGNPRSTTGAWDVGAYVTSTLAPPYLHPL